MKYIFEKAVAASRELNMLSQEKIDEVLLKVADRAVADCQAILDANLRDLSRMDSSDPMYDRLLLTR